MKFRQLVDKYFPEVRPYRPSGKMIQGLVVLQLIAMFAVIVHHASMKFCLGLDYMYDIRFYFWCYVFPITIPIFIAVSGYLLLGRGNSSYLYSSGKILRILKIALVAELLCELFKVLVFNKVFSPVEFIKSYFLGLFYYNAVTWFLGVLIVLYLLYPIINKLYVQYPRGFLWMMGGCMVIQAIFFIRTLGIGEGMIPHEESVPQAYRLWNWIFYFSIGGAIKRYGWLWRLGRLWIAIALCAVNTCLFQMYLVRHFGIRYIEYTYATPICALNVIAVMCYILSLQIESIWLRNAHLLLFPGFIIGDVLLDYWGTIAIRYPGGWGLAGYICVTTASTLILVWCLTKVPILKNLLR